MLLVREFFIGWVGFFGLLLQENALFAVWGHIHPRLRTPVLMQLLKIYSVGLIVRHSSNYETVYCDIGPSRTTYADASLLYKQALPWQLFG